jgi:hypothetical protein
MATDLTQKLWDICDIVKLIQEWQAGDAQERAA